MVPQRWLIVNADDFGQSPGINGGIIMAHEQGIVTSASLMVCWPAAEQAAAYARSHPALSVGLHLDLGEWAYQQGEWVALYTRSSRNDASLLGAELKQQVDTFCHLVGRPPTHLDSHQHVHREEPVQSAALELAAVLGVPLRHFAVEVHYCGELYGQTPKGGPLPEAITVEHLAGLLAKLPPGTTELGCHPATEVDFVSMYREERAKELATLCDPRAALAVAAAGARLCSYHHFQSRPTATWEEECP
jgi:predicted glycoside hydrolase/deacetylase ChbG (UPF0249 family)